MTRNCKSTHHPASVTTQLGHTDPKFTLRVYAHMMRRGSGERARLKALVGGDAGSPAQLRGNRVTA